MKISRRTLLTGAAAAAVAPMVPALPAAADVTVFGMDMAAGPSASTWTMWAVGSDPESFDWRPIAADSDVAAFRTWLGLTRNDPADLPADLSERVTRVEIWDGLGPEGVRPGDWIDAGMGHVCFRCDCECWADSGARNLDGEVVCEECVTIADLAAHDEECAIEALADRIAGYDLDAARAWVDAENADIADEMWAEAMRRAAA